MHANGSSHVTSEPDCCTNFPQPRPINLVCVAKPASVSKHALRSLSSVSFRKGYISISLLSKQPGLWFYAYVILIVSDSVCGRGGLA
jgi:hypothetical protein